MMSNYKKNHAVSKTIVVLEVLFGCGILFLLNAFDIVRKTIPDVQLVIGGGSSKPEQTEMEVVATMRRIIDEKDLVNTVHIVGYVPEETSSGDQFVIPALAVFADEAGQSHVWVVDKDTIRAMAETEHPAINFDLETDLLLVVFMFIPLD